MNQQEIQEKNEKLKNILLKYKEELERLRRELFNIINEYQKTIDNERIKELKEDLMRHE